MPQSTQSTSTPLMIPQSVEAEELTLGLFMEEPRALDTADQNGLRRDDYMRDDHKVMYDVIRYLHERGELSAVTVVSELKARRKLKFCGGAGRVLSLADNAVGFSSTASRHIDDVIDAAKLRSLVQTGEEIARLGYEHPEKISRLVDRSVELVESMARNAQRTSGVIGDAASLSEWSVKHVLGQTEQRQKWNYPLPTLQQATGGFGRGQLVSIGAQPGVGKSAFKNQILLALPDTTRVGVINLEMDREDEQVRLLSNMTGIDSRRIWTRTGLSDAEIGKLVEAAETLGERKYDIHQGSKTIEAIRAVQKRYRYDVLMVDHTHRIEGVEDYRTLVRVSRTLKAISIDEDCAVVSLFQLNKGQEAGEVPTAERVKGGGSIHEDSDHMMFLHRTHNELGYPTKRGQIIMAKQRGGTSGWAIKTVFNAGRCAFEEVES